MELQEILITEEFTVLKTLERLDQTSRKVLFIQKEGKLLASVSDGDIRRLLLSNGKLEDTICKAANYRPCYLTTDREMEAADYMKQHFIDAIPIVDESHVIQKVLCADGKGSLCKRGNLDMPVVIMAGGKGTRLYPYTRILPKALVPVADTTIIEHIIHQFLAAGCTRFYVVVNHKKNMIKAYLNELEKEYSVTFIEEKELLGTGGGISLLKGMVNETFILTNCDILIRDDFEKIASVHRENKNVVTMVCSLKSFDVPYGVVEIGPCGAIEKMEEKPHYAFFTNTGCYMVEPEVIRQVPENQAVGFPEIIEDIKKKGHKVGVYPVNEGAWLDMGNMEELKRMEQVLKMDGKLEVW